MVAAAVFVLAETPRWEPEAEPLAGYARVTPELLASRALQQRVDSKFLLTRRQLVAVLATLTPSCALLASPGQWWGTYRSVYLDTPELRLFHDHRRGRRRRFKVRLRHYLDRRLSYLEVKLKGRPGLTAKRRRRLDYGASELAAADWQFIADAIAPEQVALGPVMTVTYQRITLVGVSAVERVTFDLGLTVADERGEHSFGDAVIAEVKQPRFDVTTPAVSALRAVGARKARASKYCLGLMALRSDLRANRLQPAFRRIQGANHV